MDSYTQSSKEAKMARMQHLMNYLKALGYNTEDITISDALNIMDSFRAKLETKFKLEITADVLNPWR